MPAYIIVDLEITDPALFDQYRAAVPATISAYGGKYLVRGGAFEALEGNWRPKRVIVLQFDNMARLKEWYGSPDYAPLRSLRAKCAKANVIAVEGL